MTDPLKGRLRDESAARRFHEAIHLHRLALSHEEIAAKRYMAVKLEDGRSDGTAYDSRRAAMVGQGQMGYRLCFYFQIPMKTPNVYICDTLLWYARSAHNNGYRPDLDDSPYTGLYIPNNLDEIEYFANDAHRRSL